MFSSTNHFVIRNGKIVSKSDAQVQSSIINNNNSNVQAVSSINIIKPAATIIQHLPQPSSHHHMIVNSNSSVNAGLSWIKGNNINANSRGKGKCVYQAHQENQQGFCQHQDQAKNIFSKESNNTKDDFVGSVNDDDWKMENYKQISKLCEYYQGRLRQYEDKIKQLQKEIDTKDIIIKKLNIQKQKQKALNIFKQINKQRQSEGISTARDSRQSVISIKQNNNDKNVTSISSSCLKLKIKDILAARKLQSYENENDDEKQEREVCKRESQGNLCDSKLEEQLQQQSVVMIKNEEQRQIEKQIDEQSLAVSIGNTDSIIQLHSISSLHSGKSVCEEVSTEKQNRTFFDTSTLMDRLNKSASLVRNIKKFLQPSGCPKSPQQQQQQSEQPVEPIHEHLSIIPCTSTSHISHHNKQNQFQQQQQYQQFIDDLIQKNEQILCLIQELTLQKDQQIRQIKKYYQDAFNKIMSVGRIDAANINFSYDFYEKKQNNLRESSSSTAIKNNLMQRVQRNASKRFSRVSSRNTLKKYIEIEPSQAQVLSQVQNKQNIQILQSKSQLLCTDNKQIQNMKSSLASISMSVSSLSCSVSNQNILKQNCDLITAEDLQKQKI